MFRNSLSNLKCNLLVLAMIFLFVFLFKTKHSESKVKIIKKEDSITAYKTVQNSDEKSKKEITEKVYESKNIENTKRVKHIPNITNEYPEVDNKSSRVRELSDFREFSSVAAYSCVPLRVGELSPSICVKDPKIDQVISGTIVRNGIWEEEILHSIIDVVNKVPQATFIDLGSNIGVYSVAVAAMGRNVVAVDAMYDNLALIQQSQNKNGKGTIRLIYNSISDHYETLYPYNDDPKNPGGINLLTADQLKKGGSDNWHASPIVKSKVAGPPVESVTTIDVLNYVNASIVVLKVDVEGFECQALSTPVLDQSTGVYIPYIFLEWRLIVANLANRCPDYKVLEKRFLQNGYKPRNPNYIQQPMGSDSSKWNDVLWVHENETIDADKERVILI